MPMAPEWLREKWGGYEGVGEDKAMKFLEDHGYQLTKGWFWIQPEKHDPTEAEREAALFLVMEWDFGPIVDALPDGDQVIDPRLTGWTAS